jgi:hypothetical protein
MSVMAVGPALDIDGPLPVRPRHSLLETMGVVVSTDATRVLNGVNVYGYPTGCPSLWEPCSDGTYRTKGSESEQLLPRFDSFVVYKPITCSSIGMGDPEDFSGRIAKVLEATLSSGVEEALAAGVDQSSNPFFGDAEVAVLNSGTAVSPGVGLSFLEEAIGATCRKGMIHATPAVIAALQAFPFGDMEMNLETANGTPVVSGMGYQDVDTPWLATPDATEDWIFATGPVEVHLGPLVMTDISETLDRSDNTVTFRAEHYVVSIWDTALQAAVLVDWAT